MKYAKKSLFSQYFTKQKYKSFWTKIMNKKMGKELKIFRLEKYL